MSGPAVGARGQIGISQEGIWGKKQPAPQYFIDLVSEGITSELGNLLSNALRADRAVHKRIPGVESAGGDFNVEVAAEGLGQMFKHALGSVISTRLDHAFVLKVIDAGVTSAVLDVVVAAGLATDLTVTLTGGTGTGVNLDLSSASYDTIQEVMDAINAGGTGLAAYSVSSFQAGGVEEDIQAADYAAASDNANKLEEMTAIELIGGPGNTKDFLVSFGWGAYSHLVDAAPTLPPGLTIEVGRDIAAFTYSGCKVNTMTLTADTGEIFGGVFNLMAKGGTTASRAIASGANTGHEKNAFGIRYTGENPTCTLDIDKVNHVLTINADGTSEDLALDVSVPYTDPLTGQVHPVHTLGGLVAYLNSLAYITCTISDYGHYDIDSSILKDYTAIDITGTSLIIFNVDSGDLVAEPVTWGDYKGTDSGVAVDLIAEIVLGGVPGTATIRFSGDGGSTWGDTYTTSATTPTEIRIADNVDTGFSIFFPDDTALVINDRWTVSTFKLAETPTYDELDPFAGFDGALTIDGSAQPIMGWNATINNNIYGEKYDLGSRTRGSLPEQRRTTEGVMTVEFDNLDLYRRFVNGTSGVLNMVFTSDTYISNSDRSGLGDSKTQYSLTIVQPKVEYDGSTPLIEGEGIIEHDMPYTSLYDSVNAIPDFRVTLVNNKAYL